MARCSLIFLLLFCTLTGWAQNIRVNTLTATTGLTNLGAFKMTNGASNLRVLTSDANGNASWQPPGSVTDTNAMARLNGLGTNGTWNGHTVSAGGVTNKVPVTNASYVTTGGFTTNKTNAYFEGPVAMSHDLRIETGATGVILTNGGITGMLKVRYGDNSGPGFVHATMFGAVTETERKVFANASIGSAEGVALSSGAGFGWSSSATEAAGTIDTWLARLSSGVLVLSASSTNAVPTGSLQASNGTFGGTITGGAGTFQGALLANNGLTVNGDTLLGDTLTDGLSTVSTFSGVMNINGAFRRRPSATTDGVLPNNSANSFTYRTATNFAFSFDHTPSPGQSVLLTVSNFNVGTRIFGTNTAGVYDVYARSNRTVWEFESNSVTQMEFWYDTNLIAAGKWFLVDWRGPEYALEFSTGLSASTNGATRVITLSASAGGGDITGGNANQFTESAGVLTIADGSLQTNNVLRGALTTLGATATTNAGYLTVGGAQTNKGPVHIASTLRITGSGALTLDDILSATVLGTDGTGLVIPRTASEVLDVIGSTRGSVLYRGAAGWAILVPGTAGQFLETQGAAADPRWGAPAGSGDVTAASTFGTDNVAIRSDGTGKGVQGSGVTINDSGTIGTPGDIAAQNMSVTNLLTVFSQIALPGALSINTSVANHTVPSTFTSHLRATSTFTNTGPSRLGGLVNADDSVIVADDMRAGTVHALGDSEFAGLVHMASGLVTNNITYRSAIFSSASQATNHTTDYNLAVRHQNLTNDVWYSAVSNVPATNLFRAVVHVFRNASGSTWRIGANNSATGFRMSGTNDVAIASGQQARVYFDTDCTGFAGLTNCTIQVVKFDNP